LIPLLVFLPKKALFSTKAQQAINVQRMYKNCIFMQIIASEAKADKLFNTLLIKEK